MFWIAVAAQAAAANTPPPPQHVQGLMTVDDYPPGALDRNEQGAVYFQLLVSPEGRVDTCKILLSSGFNDLDYATCQLVTKRARFSPAQGEDGKPIYGTYRQVIDWRISNRPVRPDLASLPSMPPDLDLTINQAPEGVELPLQFDVSYFVKPNGTASHCKYSPRLQAPSETAPPQILVDLACSAALQSAIQPERNSRNEPVEVSDSATVRFSIKR